MPRHPPNALLKRLILKKPAATHRDKIQRTKPKRKSNRPQLSFNPSYQIEKTCSPRMRLSKTAKKTIPPANAPQGSPLHNAKQPPRPQRAKRQKTNFPRDDKSNSRHERQPAVDR